MERKKRLGDVKYYVVIDSKGKANFSSDFQLIKGLEIIKDFYDFHEANNFTKEYNRTNVSAPAWRLFWCSLSASAL